MDLIERLQNRDGKELVERFIADPASRTGSSDERFNILVEALTSKSTKAGAQGDWATEEGRRIAHIARGPNRVVLTLDEKSTPDFGGYLVERLPELYRAFQQQRQRE
jgi:ParB family chromosome partitioning protein